MEKDFWASTDPDSSLYDWKFPDPPHTIAFLSEAVHCGAEAVTFVFHDADDGSWQFLGDSMASSGEPVLSCLHHPIDDDPNLKELADLPRGWCAHAPSTETHAFASPAMLRTSETTPLNPMPRRRLLQAAKVPQ